VREASFSRDRRSDESGQALTEVAIVFPLLVLIAVALVQLAIYYHAENVVVGAVQEGARVAASEDRTVGDGVARTRTLLQAGLGPSAGSVAVEGIEGTDAVVIQATGGLRTIIPLVGDLRLPLRARGVAHKERFGAGPGS
jgi:Flp pilus assembly protein TadG